MKEVEEENKKIELEEVEEKKEVEKEKKGTFTQGIIIFAIGMDDWLKHLILEILDEEEEEEEGDQDGKMDQDD